MDVPADVSRFVGEGDAAFVDEDYETAVSKYTKALDGSRKDASVLCKRAAAHIKLENFTGEFPQQPRLNTLQSVLFCNLNMVIPQIWQMPWRTQIPPCLRTRPTRWHTYGKGESPSHLVHIRFSLSSKFPLLRCENHPAAHGTRI